MNENSLESNQESFIIPGYENASLYCQDALCNILAATKASNELPSAGDDFDYYSTFQGFRTVMLHKGQAILSLMTSLIQKHNIRGKFQGRELEEKFDLLVDVNDVILENISNYLDEATGIKQPEEELIIAVKPQNAINTSWNKKQFSSSPSQNYKLLAAKNISRPQLTFKDKIDNSNNPFMPVIKEKPNSIKPLAITLEKDDDKEEFCHPYETEIEKFSVAEYFLQEVEPILPKPLEETPLIFIKTKEQLKILCEELRQVKEFAVDLEHHSYRSFQGFTCLMQISTREKDYIIDAIELRSELYILNEVFTDPKIVKVFHGADMDVLWLQRDFGIYIVNLFDTGQAARVLHFAHLSLSYLLKHYCKLDLDKQFQLADWRIRPLPNEMIKYARQDTHYLLYVYDCLRNDLIKNGNETKNLLRSAFERSRLICLKKYEKPAFSEDKYIELYKKSKKILNAKQLYCLKELYSWRDKIARENDESLLYVLPNHMLLQIAEALPREQQGILACCNPIPPLVKQQLNELHSIVLKANESSMKQLAILELQQKSKTVKLNNQVDLNNLTHCLHDILHVEEKKINSFISSDSSLPLITKEDSPAVELTKQPSLSALFESLPKKSKKTSETKRSSDAKVSEILSKLYSPFQRYEMTEQLQINTDLKTTSCDAVNKDEMVNIQNNKEQSSDEEICNNEISIISEEQNSTSINNPTPNSSVNTSNASFSETLSSTPLRNKSNKKKKRRPEPNVSIICTSVKKAKIPDVVVIDDDTFTPFDYSKADYNVFSGKKNSKETYKPETEHNFKAPGKHHGRSKKHFKQATFGEQSKTSNKKWPKKK